MFSAANTLSLVLQIGCEDFGSFRRSLAKTLHTLESISNDVNNNQFQLFAQSTRRKVKLDNLTIKKIPQKDDGAIFKTVTR